MLRRLTIALLITLLLPFIGACASAPGPGGIDNAERQPERSYLNYYPASLEVPEGWVIAERELKHNEERVELRPDGKRTETTILIIARHGYDKDDLYDEPTRLREAANSPWSGFEEIRASLYYLNDLHVWEMEIGLKNSFVDQQGLLASTVVDGSIYRICLSTKRGALAKYETAFREVLKTLKFED